MVSLRRTLMFPKPGVRFAIGFALVGASVRQLGTLTPAPMLRGSLDRELRPITGDT